MNIEIVGRKVDLTDAICAHVRDRLNAALDQHDRAVEHVQVVLEDINGPKGGRDMLCRVLVKLNRGRVFRVQREGVDLYANVSLAADVVKRTAGRLVNRKRWQRVNKAA